MHDVIYAGQIEKAALAPLLQKFQWQPEKALMLLEQTPTRWHGPEAVETNLVFARYADDQDWSLWQNGRIFDAAREICWSWQSSAAWQVIYSGVAIQAQDFPELQPVSTDDWGISPSDYLLWGRSLEPDETMDQAIFFELQIPRLLSYPVTCKESLTRLSLKMQCYHDHKTGQIQHYRFCTVEAQR